MSLPQITLKSVFELRVDSADQPLRYHIPAYQRGYRWTSKQVTDLLDDIRAFTKRENPKPEEFYCLQPLVLRVNHGGAFEVVDGQQRLTTLLLILRHFNERQAVKYQMKLYELTYQTRQGLDVFLQNPSTELAASNIDFFHIDQAVKTIESWFSTKESEVESIKDALLNKAKVIWFQLSPDENAIAAFTRLNVGKIPLTSGELIRALFLRRSNGDPNSRLQLGIAYEWDLLEKALQNNDFWYFIRNNPPAGGGRIDFLFDLVAREQGMKPSADDYATFSHFSLKLNGKDANPEQAWLEIKKTFMLLEEWYENRELYHLIGFLIFSGLDVITLRNLAAGTTKKNFKKALRAQVIQRALGGAPPAGTTSDQLRDWIADQLDGMQYGTDSPRIRSTLLLFNIATLLQNSGSNIRFQFESFKTANWDIEHVRSVASDRPGNRKGQHEWLKHSLGYLQLAKEAPELQQEIEQFLRLAAKDSTDVLFESLYEKLLKHFQEADAEEPDHGIANLVLLDNATNRSYKNAVFAVKRHRILSLDQDGVFVPLCTRNAFLKCYNPKVDHVMFWTDEDKDGYRNAMINSLFNFITGAQTHE